MDFETLVDEAVQREGQDFSVYGNRVSAGTTPWHYESLAASTARSATSMLDMGTGAGEVLVQILEDTEGEIPQYITAIEGFEPNLPIARSALEPFGVKVLGFADDGHIPAADDEFDLIINSHEFYNTGEVARLLQPGGRFLTQQIGGRDLAELNLALDAPPPGFAAWDLDYACQQLRRAGLVIETAAEAMITTTFADIGAVIGFIQAVGWQISDFTIDDYLPRLHRLHQRICREGSFTAHSHRFLIQGQAPK